MIERASGRLAVKVPMTLANARSLLDAGCAALAAGEQVFDLAAVETADSAALAVMLGWLRAAADQRCTIKFANIPTGVRSLAELYGVAELLPLA